jgi:hypothetical protein
MNPGSKDDIGIPCLDPTCLKQFLSFQALITSEKIKNLAFETYQNLTPYNCIAFRLTIFVCRVLTTMDICKGR